MRLLRYLVPLLLAGVSLAQIIPGGNGSGPQSSIVGSIQTATGGAIKNGTLTFTLSQPAIVSGTATLATQSSSCYTSSQGNIVGIPDPVVAPVTTTNTASGTLPSGTYYVTIYYANAGGTSAQSPEAVVSLTSTGTINVTAPVLQPSAALGYGIAIGTTSGGEFVQGSITGWTQYQQTSALSTSLAPPTSNSSNCALYFSDVLIPTGTNYTVNLVNQRGSQVAGYPQTWCTYGGATGVINVSQGAPTGNCSTSGVFYPTPILSNSSSNAAQSINSDLSVGGNVSVVGSLSTGGSFSAQQIGSVFYADRFPGASAAIQINSAMAACQPYNNTKTNIGCTIIIPSSMGCGEPNQAQDNVVLMDLRGCAQSQGLRFNVPVAATTIRSKMLLQDNYNLGTIGATSAGHGAVTGYFLSFPDSPDLAANTVEALNGTISINSLTGHMTQTLVGVEAEAFANPVGGGFTVDDVRGLTANSQCGATGAVTCAQLVSAYAQAPLKGPGGTVTNAYSLLAQQPTLAVTGEKKSILAQSARFGDLVSVGSASANNNSVGLSIFDPNNLLGTNQFGIQSAIQTTSAATSEGAGGVFRADVAAATTQAINEGVVVQTPTLHAGSVITTWEGLHVQKAPTAGTACSLAIDGSTSGSACLNAPATGGVTNTLPSVTGTITVTIGSGTSTTNGTAIASLNSQAQPAITITGATVTDTATCALNAAPPATWQTGIHMLPPVVTANTVTPWLSNATAGSITPVAAVIRCTVTR